MSDTVTMTEAKLTWYLQIGVKMLVYVIPLFFPHLGNTAEFDNFRLAMRSIIINKVIDVDTWLTTPKAIWVTE